MRRELQYPTVKKNPLRWRKNLVHGAHIDWIWGDRHQGPIAVVRARKAQAAARFLVALDATRDLSRWRAARPPYWNAMEVLEHISGFDALPVEAQNGSIQDFKVWALAWAITRGDTLAAQAYERVLSLRHAASKRHYSARECLRRSRRGQNRFEQASELYQQLTWLNLAVERANGDCRYLVERGLWHSRHPAQQHAEADHAEAFADFALAIELWPNDPRPYEARAMIHEGLQWWDITLQEGTSADYARALRLRVKAGQFSGEPAALAARGARLWPAVQKRSFSARVRAYAFYSLAIESDPNQADFYCARARLLQAHLPPDREDSWPQIEAAYPDWRRALALDATIDEARAQIVDYLIQTFKLETGHEQIEALLNARQSLVSEGIDAATANDILAQVARALAA